MNENEKQYLLNKVTKVLNGIELKLYLTDEEKLLHSRIRALRYRSFQMWIIYDIDEAIKKIHEGND